MAATDTIYLIRHGEVVEQLGTKDKSKNPSLNERGQNMAQALAARLKQVPIQAIYTSQLDRTQQTATPTANVHQLTIEIIAANKPLSAHIDATATAVLNTLSNAEGGSVLVVGHSNTVPMIIKALGGPELATLDHDAFGDLFILTRQTDDGKITLQREKLAW
ncbi:phosphoglycerate mutase family protein [Corallincola platygyrae]|uniref:Phosphoglycerate mutase family protein n=1 Tax=Corallincola platygyrae TaxID=1193278 RepID=A0ABW4XME6_9GAMM